MVNIHILKRKLRNTAKVLVRLENTRNERAHSKLKMQRANTMEKLNLLRKQKDKGK